MYILLNIFFNIFLLCLPQQRTLEIFSDVNNLTYKSNF